MMRELDEKMNRAFDFVFLGLAILHCDNFLMQTTGLKISGMHVKQERKMGLIL